MPPFDALREQLLCAGIAPRHVRRYIGELRDHYDDLVTEEVAAGASRNAAEIRARTRLGSDDDLAEVMLAQRALHSFAARYPWAVFGIGPIASVLLALVFCFAVEMVLFVAAHALFPQPTAALRENFVIAIAVWNALWTFIAPLVIAVVLCIIGLRQRLRPTWIFVGVFAACFFGAFQEIHWSDDGHRGLLSFGSGLLPPFHAKLIVGGLYRLAFGIALAGALYWYDTRRRKTGAGAASSAINVAAE